MIKNNGSGCFETTHFIVLVGTGPEIADRRLGKQAVDRFGGRFSPRTREVDETGWTPYPRRAEGRVGTRLGFSLTRSQGRFRIMGQTLSKTGGNPF
jgi:hypothetical protein